MMALELYALTTVLTIDATKMAPPAVRRNDGVPAGVHPQRLRLMRLKYAITP